MSAPPRNPDLLQEEDQVSRAHVIMAMLGVLAISAGMVVWAWATTAQLTTSLRPTRDFPEQRLQPSASPPQANEPLFGEQPGLGEQLNADQERALTTYRWLDRSRGIVTLPIDQAMDRIAGESAR
jgi:hypothetical protein